MALTTKDRCDEAARLIIEGLSKQGIKVGNQPSLSALIHQVMTKTEDEILAAASEKLTPLERKLLFEDPNDTNSSSTT